MDIVIGDKRLLTDKEIKTFPEHKFKWVVIKDYSVTIGEKKIYVPKGFACNLDIGLNDSYSNIFHEWLYTTHSYDGDIECGRREADNIMFRILRYEISSKSLLESLAYKISAFFFNIGLYLNIFGKYDRIWNECKNRDVIILVEDEEVLEKLKVVDILKEIKRKEDIKNIEKLGKERPKSGMGSGGEWMLNFEKSTNEEESDTESEESHSELRSFKEVESVTSTVQLSEWDRLKVIEGLESVRTEDLNKMSDGYISGANDSSIDIEEMDVHGDE